MQKKNISVILQTIIDEASFEYAIDAFPYNYPILIFWTKPIQYHFLKCWRNLTSEDSSMGWEGLQKEI